jgi:hypothetical protein
MQRTEKQDIYTRITNQIVSHLEKGVRPWVRPWNAERAAGRITRPLRHNGKPYSGINVLSLWASAMAKLKRQQSLSSSELRGTVLRSSSFSPSCSTDPCLQSSFHSFLAILHKFSFRPRSRNGWHPVAEPPQLFLLR